MVQAKYPQINVRVPPDLDNAVRAVASDSGKSVGSVVRAAIKKHVVAVHEQTPAERLEHARYEAAWRLGRGLPIAADSWIAETFREFGVPLPTAAARAATAPQAAPAARPVVHAPPPPPPRPAVTLESLCKLLEIPSSLPANDIRALARTIASGKGQSSSPKQAAALRAHLGLPLDCSINRVNAIVFTLAEPPGAQNPYLTPAK